MRENDSSEDFAFRRVDLTGSGDFELEDGTILQITADAIAINGKTTALREFPRLNYLITRDQLKPGFIRTFD